jgi:hypothetical protein
MTMGLTVSKDPQVIEFDIPVDDDGHQIVSKSRNNFYSMEYDDIGGDPDVNGGKEIVKWARENLDKRLVTVLERNVGTNRAAHARVIYKITVPKSVKNDKAHIARVVKKLTHVFLTQDQLFARGIDVHIFEITPEERKEENVSITLELHRNLLRSAPKRGTAAIKSDGTMQVLWFSDPLVHSAFEGKRKRGA